MVERKSVQQLKNWSGNTKPKRCTPRVDRWRPRKTLNPAMIVCATNIGKRYSIEISLFTDGSSMSVNYTTRERERERERER